MDRLSILELKHYHRQNKSPRQATKDAEILGLLKEQVDDLCVGMDELVADLLAGCLRLKFY